MSKLIYGHDKLIADWVSLHTYGVTDQFEKSVAIGIVRNDKIIAGIVYNNMMVDGWGAPYSIEMSIYSVDKKWCTRHNLKALFYVPFTQYKLRRITALCSAQNEGVQMFIKKLGFVQEGYHREAYHDGTDALSFGMLKKDCEWL